MNFRFSVLLLSLTLVFTLSACSENNNTPNGDAPITYKSLDWPDLMPKKELQLLEEMRNQPIDHNAVSAGSDLLEEPEDQLLRQMEGDLSAEPKPADIDPERLAKEKQWQAMMTSTNIRPELDGSYIKVPGYLVPLEFDDQQRAKEFFLVPYFGACIHVPPPPPNQIIHIHYEKGLKADKIMYNAFEVSGQLNISEFKHERGHSAYAIKADAVTVYHE